MPCSKNLRAEFESVYFIASSPACLFNATTMFAWLGSDSNPLPPQLTVEQEVSRDYTQEVDMSRKEQKQLSPHKSWMSYSDSPT